MADLTTPQAALDAAVEKLAEHDAELARHAELAEIQHPTNQEQEVTE